MPHRTREDVHEHLQELEAKRAELMTRLGRSLMIERLWPGCFEYGRMKSGVTGSPSNGYAFHLYRGDGEVRHWPLDLHGFERRPDAMIPTLTSEEVPQELIDRVIDATFRKEDAR